MSIAKKHFWMSGVWVPFPPTAWHLRRNERIYRFLWLKDLFERDELVKFVWREQYLLVGVKGVRHFRWFRYSTFVENFSRYLVEEFLGRGLVKEVVVAGKVVYKVVRKPTKQVINEICAYTWVVDPSGGD